MKHARLAREVFNRPHMIEPGYGRVFVSALARHGFNIRSLADAEGVRYDADGVQAMADDYDRADRKLFAEVDGIAVIPIEGTLAHRYGHLDPHSGMTGYDGIQTKLEAALDDPEISGIVLDINSPGGAVAGCFDLADQIYEARQQKPIWAICDELAASAAYALASAATRIIAPRTAQVGSIGVLTMHVDQSQMVADMGLDVTFIFAGDHKVDGNAFEPLPDDVRAEIQADIDEVYDMFTALVGRNRGGMSQQQAKDTEARVYGAAAAQQVGLIDAVMPTHQVLDAFQRELAPRGPFQTFQRGATTMLSMFGRKKPNSQVPSDQTASHTLNDNGTVAGFSAADAPADIHLACAGMSDEQVAAFEAAGCTVKRDANDAAESITLPQAFVGATGEALTAVDGNTVADNAHIDTQHINWADAQAASLEKLVSLCSEHNCADLAQPLRDRGVTAEAAEQIMADVDDIRDKAAATFPDDPQAGSQLAEQFIHAAYVEQRFGGAFSSLMVEASARMSGEEVDHHPPETAQAAGKGSINAHDVHKRHNTRA